MDNEKGNKKESIARYEWQMPSDSMSNNDMIGRVFMSSYQSNTSYLQQELRVVDNEATF